MYQLGKVQELEILRIKSVGAFLTGELLLPKKELKEDDRAGKTIKVFVYKDNKNRPVATKKTPKLLLGEINKLKVVDTTKIGAFLDWGLDKDLLLPFHEQTSKPQKGQEVLVSLYLDKSERFCATMRIRELLKTDSPYKDNDWVKGTVYAKSDVYGIFVAVDNIYEARIAPKDVFGIYQIGQTIEARVSRIQKNGRLDLVLQEKNYLLMDTNASFILEVAQETGGELFLNDQSSPEDVKEKLMMSKSDFKRAIGRLLKQNKIRLTDRGIKLN